MCGSVVHVSVSVCKGREYDKEEEEKSWARFLGYCSGIRLMLIRGTTKNYRSDQLAADSDKPVLDSDRTPSNFPENPAIVGSRT